MQRKENESSMIQTGNEIRVFNINAVPLQVPCNSISDPNEKKQENIKLPVKIVKTCLLFNCIIFSMPDFFITEHCHLLAIIIREAHVSSSYFKEIRSWKIMITFYCPVYSLGNKNRARSNRTYIAGFLSMSIHSRKKRHIPNKVIA